MISTKNRNVNRIVITKNNPNNRVVFLAQREGFEPPEAYHFNGFQVFPNKLHQRLDTIIQSRLFPRNKGKNCQLSVS